MTSFPGSALLSLPNPASHHSGIMRQFDRKWVEPISFLHKLFPKSTDSDKRVMIHQLFPIIKRLKGYKPSDFFKDARAGLNVSLLGFPQAMAYAMIAGLPIQVGVHASALASMVGPLFASSRFLMIGPSNATAVLLMSSFLTLNLDDTQRLQVLPLLLIMIALFMFAGILLKVGIVLQYVSRAVISGYITAAAFLIMINQLRYVLGIHIPKAGTFWHSLLNTINHIDSVQLPVVYFSIIAIALYILISRLAPKLPALALTIVTSTLIYQGFQHLGYQFDVLPYVKSGAWPFTPPKVELGLINTLLGTAFAVSLLSLIESASIAKTLAAQAGDTLDVSQQLLSLGVSNTINAFTGGMPVSGSPTRSVLNYNSGAKTPVSSIVSGSIVMVGILLFSPLLHYIPQAALASLVIIVGASLIRWDTIKVFLKTSKSDGATFLTTFVAGLFFPLDVAIYFGVGLSIALFLKKVSAPTLEEIDFNDQGELVGKKEPTRSAISIVHVEGDLFFGSTDVFLDRMRDLVESPNLKVMVLRLLNAHHIDATASLAIGNLVEFARKNGRDVVLSGVRDDLKERLERSGLSDIIGRENIFDYTPDNLTLSTRNALLRAQDIIGSKDTDVILMVKKKR